jgi:glycosyltransferase involved in cell wall biosynthesis
MRDIIFDNRWSGGHGIGRFSDELSKRINFEKVLDSNVKPTSPFDIFVTGRYLFGKDDVYFTPGFNAPVINLRSSIITIHDLNHIDIEGNSSYLKKMYYRHVLLRACLKCAAIITVSQFSKQRICDWSGVSPDKVHVVGNGVGGEFTPSVIGYQPGYRYLLCVSNRKVHKNELAIIEAFSQSSISDDIKLIFTGNPTEEITKFAKKHNVAERIVFSGFVEDAQLPSLYKGAVALVFPSRYEGFGLPVIEAMACGIPVITSNSTSLGEIAGNAALLVSPENIAEITEAINRITNDVKLREELIIAGFLRAKNFTWDKTAEKVKNILANVLKGKTNV